MSTLPPLEHANEHTSGAGARERERFMEDPLAEALLRGDVKEGDNVKVTRKKGSDELVFKPLKRKPKSDEKASTK